MIAFVQTEIVKLFRWGAFALLAIASLASAQNATFVDSAGVAVGGTDVVAYFTMGKPVPGDAKFTAQHNGATYHFASAENLNLFKADASKYAPQYGGYCAFATAFGKKAPGDPSQWAVVDGKLYLNVNADVQKKWTADIPGFISKADGQWTKIRDN